MFSNDYLNITRIYIFVKKLFMKRSIKLTSILVFLMLCIFATNCSKDDNDQETQPDATVATPAVTLNTSAINFGEITLSETSASYTLEVSGSNLTTDITLAVTDEFSISLDNISFSDSVSIPASSVNTLNTVHLRFSPTSIGEVSQNLRITSNEISDVTIPLTGIGMTLVYNYKAFDRQPTGFGSGLNQSEVGQFTVHNDLSNISQIKMYLQINCSSSGCDDWDRFANVKIKDPSNDTWYEIGRYITPYWVGTELLDRGLEFDVTDFKSLLQGTVELSIHVENWTTKADLISIDFDYIEGTPDYPYYAVSEVLGLHNNSLSGIPYGVSHTLDLDKQITIPSNAENVYLRTIISGWGHATPTDADGRPCAEWCFRTHNVLINDAPTFAHYMGPLGCASNPINNQNPGNWTPDRAGWCPGMAVPPRIDEISTNLFGNTFNFKYQLEDWINDENEGGAFYATSTYVVVKSNSIISPATVAD